MGVKRIVVHCVEVEDKPGGLQKLLSDIASAGVDLFCLMASSRGEGKGCVCLSAKDPGAMSSCLKDLDISATETAGFVICGEDKVGAAAEALKPLADAGINGIAGSAMVCENQYGILIVVTADDSDAAATALGA